ncbi:MAG: UMP kinase [Bacillales bacterium]|jgi:uridylate kinase|nr:UMP kinase [Bacillales bacterium]
MIKYKRILLKISGESLQGEERILDKTKLVKIADIIKDLVEEKVQVSVVVGAGNIWRGALATEIDMERITADYMGMLGTVINCLALQSILEKRGLATRVCSSLPIPAVCEPYIRKKALHHLEEGRVVLLAGGTGNPFFTTDTTAALRASELGCEIILMAKNGTDGILDKDPRQYNDAKLIKKLSYNELIRLDLKVMDATAVTLLRDNDILLRVFNINDPENIKRIVNGENIGTIVVKE